MSIARDIKAMLQELSGEPELSLLIGGYNAYVAFLNCSIIIIDRNGMDNFWGEIPPWGGGNQNSAPSTCQPPPPDDPPDVGDDDTKKCPYDSTVLSNSSDKPTIPADIWDKAKHDFDQNLLELSNIMPTLEPSDIGSYIFTQQNAVGYGVGGSAVVGAIVIEPAAQYAGAIYLGNAPAINQNIIGIIFGLYGPVEALTSPVNAFATICGAPR